MGSATASTVTRDQALAFRLDQHRLAQQDAATLADAAACPASDFSRGSALLALAARFPGVTREEYDSAIDGGALVLAPCLRAAIHAVAPDDLWLYGRGLIAVDDDELGEQLGDTLAKELRVNAITPRAALEEVAAAISAALSDGSALTKDELHEELRGRVRSELLPWCRGCGSHHVAPMLWRFAGVRVGMRFDSQRRFRVAEPGEERAPVEAVRRFLRFYGPATPKEFATWTGVARAHARRLWDAVEYELTEIRLESRRTWLLAADAPRLDSPSPAEGVRLLPARDPYLQMPDRATLVPEADLRKRLFRPVGGPGAVLRDGRLTGLWRARHRGTRIELDVEVLEPGGRADVEQAAARLAAVRGARSAVLRWS